jgi:hypothetical protein
MVTPIINGFPVDPLKRGINDWKAGLLQLGEAFGVEPRGRMSEILSSLANREPPRHQIGTSSSLRHLLALKPSGQQRVGNAIAVPWLIGAISSALLDHGIFPFEIDSGALFGNVRALSSCSIGRPDASSSRAACVKRT